MTNAGVQLAVDTEGGRLHLQHGPIDLIIRTDGVPAARAKAHAAALECFEGLLEELVSELPLLRTPLATGTPVPGGSVAQRMYDAVVGLAGRNWVTPMAAVAGAVADEVGAAMDLAAPLSRWMVNNGGDIAFGLAPGQQYRAGLVIDPRRAGIGSTVVLEARFGVGGIATSGRHGRSFSLGIADSVTVFAATAAAADVAATLIANEVDVGPHPAITRRAACELDPDSDLGSTLVTVDVAVLTHDEAQRALAKGMEFAEHCVGQGFISGAVLHLANQRAATSGLGSALVSPAEPAGAGLS